MFYWFGVCEAQGWGFFELPVPIVVAGTDKNALMSGNECKIIEFSVSLR